jgi:hypothetical protein
MLGIAIEHQPQVHEQMQIYLDQLLEAMVHPADFASQEMAQPCL